jgi:FkbM family methyltransferase
MELRVVLEALVNRVPARIARRFRTGTVGARLLGPVLEVVLRRRAIDIVVRSGPAAGLRLPINPRCEKYYWTGMFELDVQQAIQRVLRPGDSFWDIGAHIGLMTAIAAKCVGPEGRVRAFEPMPSNRARLLRTLELNGLGQVAVSPAAVADRSGVATLHQHAETSMWSLARGTAEGGITVDCVTLDELFLELRAEIPVLVKIDAEGAELEILRGGQKLITQTDAAFIVELHTPDLFDQAEELLPGRVLEMVSKTHVLARSPS